MDRKPEHLAEDARLRSEFIQQQSWDEWAAIHAPFFLEPNVQEVFERILAVSGTDATYQDMLDMAVERWSNTLDPETRLVEQLYLLGYSHIQRLQKVEQMHAAFRRNVEELGLLDERLQDVDFREQFGE